LVVGCKFDRTRVETGRRIETAENRWTALVAYLVIRNENRPHLDLGVKNRAPMRVLLDGRRNTPFSLQDAPVRRRLLMNEGAPLAGDYRDSADEAPLGGRLDDGVDLARAPTKTYTGMPPVILRPW
jgi:hypothetical protein